MPGRSVTSCALTRLLAHASGLLAHAGTSMSIGKWLDLKGYDLKANAVPAARSDRAASSQPAPSPKEASAPPPVSAPVTRPIKREREEKREPERDPPPAMDPQPVREQYRDRDRRRDRDREAEREQELDKDRERQKERDKGGMFEPWQEIQRGDFKPLQVSSWGQCHAVSFTHAAIHVCMLAVRRGRVLSACHLRSAVPASE